MSKFLVIGAGLSGATVARVLADAGNDVDLIEMRNHVAGNCYDYVDSATGTRIHAHGGHFLHHGSEVLHKFLSRFSNWLPYEHHVVAEHYERLIPLPVNANTMEMMFDVHFSSESEAAAFLQKLRAPYQDLVPTNAKELFYHSMGEALAEAFFVPYTEKHWGMPADKVAVATGARLPVRTNRDNRYFTDKYQYLPAGGYTAMVQNMLNHPRICAALGEMSHYSYFARYDHVFTTQPIDQLCDYALGELPYRSIKFVTDREPRLEVRAAAINTPSPANVYTRSLYWNNLPGHGKVSLTTHEISCDAKDNVHMATGEPERYYPIATERNEQLYEQYSNMVKATLPNVSCLGRLGAYKYLDMCPAVQQAMQLAAKFS